MVLPCSILTISFVFDYWRWVNDEITMKRFFALSRTPHGILDMATPAFCALLWLGAFPPYEVILLALATAFAGYTAIYALNDLVGFQQDKEKFSETSTYCGFSVDASVFHHPIAQ